MLNQVPPQPLGDSVRHRIIAAARAEFAAQGLKGASVRAIGRRAGVTAAMINYYFQGKRALYDVVVEQAIGRLLDRLSVAMAAPDHDRVAPRLAGEYFDFLAEEGEFQRLIMREVLDRGEGLQAYARRHLRPLRDAFEQRFGTGDRAFQSAVSLFGAIAGYFLYEPLLTELLGDDLLAREPLRRRRRHIMELASVLSTWVTSAGGEGE